MDRGADLVPRTAARGSASLTEKCCISHISEQTVMAGGGNGSGRVQADTRCSVTRLGHPLTFGEFLHGLETPSRISDPPRESGVN